MAEAFTYGQIQDYLTTLAPECPAEVQQMEAYAQEHCFPIIRNLVGNL